MSIPTFKNVPNKVYYIDNKPLWHSRSVAIVGVILAQENNQLYVLGEKRSSIMDEPHKWVMPGGYIDWNELGWDGFRREVYEETSFLIDDYEKYMLNDKEDIFYIKSAPDENRQNIAIWYTVLFDFSMSESFPYNVESFTDSEVDEVKWILIQDISLYEWAFNHEKRILQAVTSHLNKGLLK